MTIHCANCIVMRRKDSDQARMILVDSSPGERLFICRECGHEVLVLLDKTAPESEIFLDRMAVGP